MEEALERKLAKYQEVVEQNRGHGWWTQSKSMLPIVLAGLRTITAVLSEITEKINRQV